MKDIENYLTDELIHHKIVLNGDDLVEVDQVMIVTDVDHEFHGLTEFELDDDILDDDDQIIDDLAEVEVHLYHQLSQIHQLQIELGLLHELNHKRHITDLYQI